MTPRGHWDMAPRGHWNPAEIDEQKRKRKRNLEYIDVKKKTYSWVKLKISIQQLLNIILLNVFLQIGDEFEVMNSHKKKKKKDFVFDLWLHQFFSVSGDSQLQMALEKPIACLPAILLTPLLLPLLLSPPPPPPHCLFLCFFVLATILDEREKSLAP